MNTPERFNPLAGNRKERPAETPERRLDQEIKSIRGDLWARRGRRPSQEECLIEYARRMKDPFGYTGPARDKVIPAAVVLQEKDKARQQWQEEETILFTSEKTADEIASIKRDFWRRQQKIIQEKEAQARDRLKN